MALEYEDGRNAGQIAKEFKCAVGEIGCPHCGVVVTGAIYDEICKVCDNDMFSFTRATKQ